ncbi:MAG: YheC/YheD family protein [Bacillota bacterium]
MQVIRGRWIKNQLELSDTFLAKLPNEFELDLGVEKVPVINKKRFGILLLKSFFMPNPKEMTVTKLGSQISAGPILGLMVRGLSEINAQQFKNYFTSKTPGLTYVFDESLLNTAKIEGYYFNDNWYYMNLPKPNYVFDRTYPSHTQNKLKLPRSVFFNPITQFSKSEVIRVLKQNSIDVPETFSGTFETVYRRFVLFYLKPDRGSFGQGIFVVKKRKTDILVYSSTSNSLTIYTNEKFLNLLGYLEKNSYILQKGICPTKLEEDPVDFRLHVLADPNPRLASLAARTSSWDFLYTSAPKKILKGADILSKKDLDALGKLISRVHFVLSRAFGLYVEFSLDVIKEEDTGKFYVIDVNGKSTRTHPQILGDNLADYYSASQKLANHLFIGKAHAPFLL